MRLKTLAAAVALLLACGAAGFAAAVLRIPYAETDRLFRQFQAAGRTVNHLSPPALRTARRNLVVGDNADTLTQSARLDLAGGPLVYRTVVPADAVYWSVSLFAHNTDTFYVADDQALGSGPFSLLIRRRSQMAPALPVRAEAVSPSREAFLIVRYTMRDRNDALSVATMKAQLAASSLGPAR